MSFKEDEEVGQECPNCGEPLFFLMSFEDCSVIKLVTTLEIDL